MSVTQRNDRQSTLFKNVEYFFVPSVAVYFQEQQDMLIFLMLYEIKI